ETTGEDGRVTGKTYESDPITGAVIGVWESGSPENTRMSFTYDVSGNRVSTTYPDGKSVRSVFNEYGQHVATTDITGNTTSHVYNAFGLPINVKQHTPDGVLLAEATYTYDDFGRLATLTRGVLTTT